LAELSQTTSNSDSQTPLAQSAKMTDNMQEDMELDKKISSPEPAKRKASEPKPKTIHFTSRNPPWTYLKLKL
jgi:hypothetical protein